MGLAFVDTKGKERVYLQSQGNLIIRTEGDLIFDVGGKVLQNHNGTSRQTIGNIPGMGSGSGGGGGSGPTNEFPGQTSVLVSPYSDLEVRASGSGSGGSSATPGSFTPWEVTGAGAGWANEVASHLGRCYEGHGRHERFHGGTVKIRCRR